MLNKKYFEELESSWDRMKSCKKPIYVYGMGDGCEKLLNLCAEKQIKIDGIFASDDFVRGQNFCGYKVEKLSDIEKRCKDFLVVLAFGTSLDDIMERIDSISENHELIAPDMSVSGKNAFEKDFFLENFDRAQKAYDLLSDDKSRDVFENITAYKITGRLDYLKKVFSDEDEGFELLDLGENEIYCDLGAYNGDTVRKFCKVTNGKYRKIYAFEPDKRNFQKCVKNCINMDNIEFINAAAWKKDGVTSFDASAGRQAQISAAGGKKVCTRSLDLIFKGGECTYIKYDVEGADFPALEGSANTISEYAPKICCALYHHPMDYIDIPLFINSICGEYDFYMRQFKYYPAWETNLFAVKGVK